jgi:hypothetical protein
MPGRTVNLAVPGRDTSNIPFRNSSDTKNIPTMYFLFHVLPRIKIVVRPLAAWEKLSLTEPSPFVHLQADIFAATRYHQIADMSPMVFYPE